MPRNLSPFRWDDERVLDEAKFDPQRTPEGIRAAEEAERKQRIAERENHLLFTTAGMSELLTEITHTPEHERRLVELLAVISRASIDSIESKQHDQRSCAVELLAAFLSERATEIASVPSILREQA